MPPTFLCFGLFFSISLLPLGSSKFNSYNEWKNSPNVQYHIQSDEGGERFFKYQTESGQYRKEKRLKDGTVVGTYGWVDSNGYLRLRDYVADKQGYRIIKTKLIYVGKNSAAEGSSTPESPPRPAHSTPDRRPLRPQGPHGARTWRPNPHQPTEAFRAPAADATPGPPPNALVPRYFESESSPGVTVFEGAAGQTHASAAAPFGPEATRYDSIPPSELVAGVDPRTSSAKADADAGPASRKFLPVEGNNELLAGGGGQKRWLATSPYRKRFLEDHQEYDGISTVQNGFRYFLPKHYHEESSSQDGSSRAGSFGYIDPFGIRRVVYYNTSPGKGFVHKKNNRYVGFASTPYDPRPNY